ncbi:MAG: hypothetical protein AB7F43_06335 [Bacteriovoracia bacterium]
MAKKKKTAKRDKLRARQIKTIALVMVAAVFGAFAGDKLVNRRIASLETTVSPENLSNRDLEAMIREKREAADKIKEELEKGIRIEDKTGVTYRIFNIGQLSTAAASLTAFSSIPVFNKVAQSAKVTAEKLREGVNSLQKLSRETRSAQSAMAAYGEELNRSYQEARTIAESTKTPFKFEKSSWTAAAEKEFIETISKRAAALESRAATLENWAKRAGKVFKPATVAFAALTVLAELNRGKFDAIVISGVERDRLVKVVNEMEHDLSKYERELSSRKEAQLAI